VQRSASVLGLRCATHAFCCHAATAAPARHGADCVPGAVITEVVSQIK
jgi:hypothetical protein